MMVTFEAHSLEDTERLAETLSKLMQGGEIVVLSSDLGGGKTAFTSFFVNALGYKSPVSSPTFTLSNIYDTPSYTIYHYDFYRLNHAGLLADELAEVVQDSTNIVIIEWPDIITPNLPSERTIEVKIHKVETSEHARRFELAFPEGLSEVARSLEQGLSV